LGKRGGSQLTSNEDADKAVTTGSCTRSGALSAVVALAAALRVHPDSVQAYNKDVSSLILLFNLSYLTGEYFT